jgi:hypothetical protein
MRIFGIEIFGPVTQYFVYLLIITVDTTRSGFLSGQIGAFSFSFSTHSIPNKVTTV